MRKSKDYPFVKYSGEVIQAALGVFETFDATKPRAVERVVGFGSEAWNLDSDSEFFSEYREKRADSAEYGVATLGSSFGLKFRPSETTVSVRLPARAQIEAVFQVFEDKLEQSRLPMPERKAAITIFIGHGRNGQWKDLKDHLHEKHGYKVEAYETGARAGYSIAEVLASVTRAASFALLVHTAEDEDEDGNLHARENVIHETGLFQGKLSFKRAIVLREDGCSEFSNLAGVQEIRYSKGAIKETFGEVLATLRREFGTD